MQLSEAIELFIDRPEISAATRRTYQYDLRQMVHYVGDKPMSEIIPADILRYGNFTNKRKGVQSSFTYNKHVKTMRTFFNWCIKAQIIERSPAAVLSRKKIDERVPKSKAMPDRKLVTLLEYVAETPRGWNPREEALVRFLADTGCRISGIANLRVKDLKLDERKAVLYEKGRVEARGVRFGRECSHALSAWLLMREPLAGQYVFSTDGHRMTNEALGQYFRRLCQRAGIGSWGPHSLRHRFGHKAIQKHPVSIVAKMLGDSVEVTMKHYLPQDEEYVEKAMLEMTTDYLIQHDIVDLLKESQN